MEREGHPEGNRTQDEEVTIPPPHLPRTGRRNPISLDQWVGNIPKMGEGQPQGAGSFLEALGGE